jgi:hypothetical protein
MFERYTERARRSVFFARYEASMFGSPYIEPEHLLLGILREDRSLRDVLPVPARDQIRGQVEGNHPGRERLSTSVDVPLSAASKRAMVYGAEEADLLRSREIECDHLVLGLLRLEPSVVAELLSPHGVGYPEVKASIAARAAKRNVLAEPEGSETAHPFAQFVAEAVQHLEAVQESDSDEPLNTSPFTRKQAMGHLIDYATAHHQWIARALVEPRVVAAGYPAEDWVAAQQYGTLPWSPLVRLWAEVNRLIAHVVAQVPEGKNRTRCRIGVAEEMPLEMLIGRYVSYVQGLVAEILADR